LHAAERSGSGLRTQAPGRKLFLWHSPARSKKTEFKQIYRRDTLFKVPSVAQLVWLQA